MVIRNDEGRRKKKRSRWRERRKRRRDNNDLLLNLRVIKYLVQIFFPSPLNV